MGLFGKAKELATTIKVNYDGKNATKGLGDLKGVVNKVVSAWALKQIASYTLSLAKMGATAETVSKSFEKFATERGRDSDIMMGKMRDATLGMVTDLELQQKAMQSMISGIKFDDMITAMEYVTKYAATTGANVSDKMTTVMTGLARGSAQFMDDVGIQVIGAKDVVGATIDQMIEKMDQFIISEEDVSVQTGQLATDFENLKKNVGSSLVPALELAGKVAGVLVGQLDELVQGAQGVAEEDKELLVLKKLANNAILREEKIKKRLIELNKNTYLFPEKAAKKQAKANEDLNKTLEAKEKLLRRISEIEEPEQKTTRSKSTKEFLETRKVRIETETDKPDEAETEKRKKAALAKRKRDNEDTLRLTQMARAAEIDNLDTWQKQDEARLDEKYKNLREQHKSNSEAMVAIDRAERAERIELDDRIKQETKDKEKQYTEDVLDIKRMARQIEIDSMATWQDQEKALLNDKYSQLYEVHKDNKEAVAELLKTEQAERADYQNRVALETLDKEKRLAEEVRELKRMNRQIEIEDMTDWYQQETEMLNDKYTRLYEIHKTNGEALSELFEAEWKERLALNKKKNLEMSSDDEKATQSRINSMNTTFSAAQSISNSIADMQTAYTNYQLNELNREYEGRKLSEKEQKEYESRKAQLMNESAQKQYQMAVWMQALAVVEAGVQAALGIVNCANDGSEQGGVYGAIIQAALAAVEFGVLIANVSAGSPTSPPSFQSGYSPEESYHRGVDSMLAMINPAEPIISAPQYQQNKETVDAIQNNTINTRSGSSGAMITNNFYGLSTDAVQQALVESKRKKTKGLAL